MAASTQTASEGALNLSKMLRALVNRRGSGTKYMGIICPFVFTVSVPPSALDEVGDKLRIAFIPSGFFVADFGVRWLADGDTDGAPALVNDFITETTAAVEDSIKLIAGSTAGQASGGADRLDDAALGMAAGGRWLTLKTTTAAATAPAAAVNLRVYLLLSYGVIAEGHRVPALSGV